MPYEKGFQFLVYLESIFKTKEDFQTLVRSYIKKYSQKSVTWEDWKQTLEAWVRDNYGVDADSLLNQIDWEAWIRRGGANPEGVNIDFSTDIARKFEKLADDYISLKGEASPDNFKDYIDSTDPQLKVVFLNRLTDR